MFLFKCFHAAFRWYEMRSMRNFVVHEYFRASDAVIWDTVHVDLPPLPAMLKTILEEDSE